MTETTDVTSDTKRCSQCDAEFGEHDDSRYKLCRNCRQGGQAPSDPPPDPGEDVEILSIDVDRKEIVPPVVRDHYWIGATKDCPWHHVTAGGVSFQKYMGEVAEVGAGRQEFRDNVHPGSPIQFLTEKHVKRILEEISQRVVRNYRVETRELHDGSTVENIRADMVTKKGSAMREFVPQDGDRPLGEFLWMLKVRHKNDRPMANPPTLVKRE